MIIKKRPKMISSHAATAFINPLCETNTVASTDGHKNNEIKVQHQCT